MDEKVFEEIIANTSPSVMKDMNLHIQGAEKMSKISNESTPKQFIIKLAEDKAC